MARKKNDPAFILDPESKVFELTLSSKLSGGSSSGYFSAIHSESEDMQLFKQPI